MNSNTFDYQQPTEESLAKLTIIRAAAKEYARILEENMPEEARESFLAMAKLEEVAMWANKAIVQNQEQV